jgi:hypothetical protein
MAEKTMVASNPPSEMIEAGKELLEQLDQVNYPVTAAFWVVLPESSLWRLMIASPEVRRLGPQRVYKHLLFHLKKLGSAVLSLSDISVVEPHDPQIQLLRRAIRANRISEINFSGNTINGVSFPDAYIYRVQ